MPRNERQKQRFSSEISLEKEATKKAAEVPSFSTINPTVTISAKLLILISVQASIFCYRGVSVSIRK